METPFLLSRLRRAEAKWEKAVNRKGYPFPDDPKEKPFTEEGFRLYCWADAWRDAFHKYEQALYDQRDVRRGMVEGLSVREPVTIYEEVI